MTCKTVKTFSCFVEHLSLRYLKHVKNCVKQSEDNFFLKFTKKTCFFPCVSKKFLCVTATFLVISLSRKVKINFPVFAVLLLYPCYIHTCFSLLKVINFICETQVSLLSLEKVTFYSSNFWVSIEEKNLTREYPVVLYCTTTISMELLTPWSKGCRI